MFRANPTDDAKDGIKIDGTHLLPDVFKPITSCDNDTTDGAPLFCCQEFEPLGHLRSVFDHTLVIAASSSSNGLTSYVFRSVRSNHLDIAPNGENSLV